MAALEILADVAKELAGVARGEEVVQLAGGDGFEGVARLDDWSVDGRATRLEEELTDGERRLSDWTKGEG